MPFPLRQHDSQAALDLEKMAQILLADCHLPGGSEEVPTPRAGAQGAGSWSRFWRRAPA
jgi:hypothetical protein